jgi:hypothetical protein
MVSAQAQRTLVKSPPELWAELSDPAALARHLGEFGEIRITRLQPEKKIEWASEQASGTVLIKPSGWGTRVTLTASGQAKAEQGPAQEPAKGITAARVEKSASAAPAPRTSPMTPAKPPPAIRGPADPGHAAPAVKPAAPSVEARRPPITAPAAPPAGHAPGAGSTGSAPRPVADAATTLPAPSATPADVDSKHPTPRDASSRAAATSEPARKPQGSPPAKPGSAPETPTPQAPTLQAPTRRGLLARLWRRVQGRPAPADTAAVDLTAPSAPSAESAGSSAEPATPVSSAPPAAGMKDSKAPPPIGREREPQAQAAQLQAPAAEHAQPPVPSVPTVEQRPAGPPIPPDPTPGAPEPHDTHEPHDTPESHGIGHSARDPGADRSAEELAAEAVTEVLRSVLDRLGAAHHRPFSRA